MSNDIDGMTRWLVVTRAAVLPMTMFAGLVGGLLAIRAPGFNTVDLLLAMAGILLAHLNNNLSNDLFDTNVGNDTEGYPRTLYAPHPLLSNLVTARQLYAAIAVTTIGDLVIAAILLDRRGWGVVAFATAGIILSGRLHRAAAPAEEARPRRAGRPRGLGSADGRRHLSRRDRSPAVAGPRGEHSLRPALHHRADGQAHRQDPV